MRERIEQWKSDPTLDLLQVGGHLSATKRETKVVGTFLCFYSILF
jgi:hypothetical protein